MIITIHDIIGHTGLSRQAIHQHRAGATSTPLPRHSRVIGSLAVWEHQDAIDVMVWIADYLDKQSSKKQGDAA